MICDWCGTNVAPSRINPCFRIKEQYEEGVWDETNPTAATICRECFDDGEYVQEERKRWREREARRGGR